VTKNENEMNLETDPELLTGTSRLTGNVAWNFLGLTLPLAAGLLAIPVLIRFLGLDRFGLLTIAWTLTGYFNVFDFGLGRALTKIVAELIGAGRYAEAPRYIWLSLVMMGLLGVVATISLALFSPWIVESLLNVPLELQIEVTLAFRILAFSIPVVMVTTALRGILEAHQRFDLVNKLRMPLGLFTFLGPLLALPIGNSLIAVFSILLGGRLLFLWLHFHACRILYSGLFAVEGMRFSGSQLMELLRLGGWMTVSNLAGPIMVSMDRVFIGALQSAEAVAYYATPQSIVFRLQVIPGAMMGVLFPAFSTMRGARENRSERAFGLACASVLLMTFPLCLLITVFAAEGLHYWLGREFSLASSVVLQLLSIGVVINAVAQVPFGFLQSHGHARVTAIFHLIELPLYIFSVVVLIVNYGIIGAAIAWLLRASIDAIALFSATALLHTEMRFNVIRAAVVTGIMVVVLLLTLGIHGLNLKLAYVLVVIAAGSIAYWSMAMSDWERGFVKNLLTVSSRKNNLK